MNKFTCLDCGKPANELFAAQVKAYQLKPGVKAIIMAKDPQQLESFAAEFEPHPTCSDCSIKMLRGLLEIEVDSTAETLAMLLTQLESGAPEGPSHE